MSKRNDELHEYLLRAGTCMTRIPLSLIYNSKLNCRNVRLIAGMKTEVHSTNSMSTSFTTLIGVEKVYSRGSMLSLTL